MRISCWPTHSQGYVVDQSKQNPLEDWHGKKCGYGSTNAHKLNTKWLNALHKNTTLWLQKTTKHQSIIKKQARQFQLIRTLPNSELLHVLESWIYAIMKKFTAGEERLTPLMEVERSILKSKGEKNFEVLFTRKPIFHTYFYNVARR